MLSIPCWGMAELSSPASGHSNIFWLLFLLSLLFAVLEVPCAH